MKTKKTFLDTAVLKKDITRFAPVWGAYMLLLAAMLVQLWRISEEYSSGAFFVVDKLYHSLWQTALIQAGYGLICAVALFSDLFSLKNSQALHTMPPRREVWFLTHITAGLLFFLVPTAIFSGGLSLLSEQWWNMGPIFLLLSSVQFLFFFGTAVFCVMCAGNALGAVSVYGLLHYPAICIWFLLLAIYGPREVDLPAGRETLLQAFPATRILNFHYFYYAFYGDTETASHFVAKLQVEEWAYLKWLPVAGIVFLAGAMLLLRKRKLEAAGDLLAFGWIKPVFTVFFSLCIAAFGWRLLDYYLMSNSSVGLLFVLLPITFIGTRMLVERTVTVFRLRNLLGLAVLMAALGAAVLLR